MVSPAVKCGPLGKLAVTYGKGVVLYAVDPGRGRPATPANRLGPTYDYPGVALLRLCARR